MNWYAVLFARFADTGRGHVGGDDAIADVDDAMGELGDVRLMGDDDDRVPVRVEFLKKGHDLVAGLGVEVAGRFVGEDDRGPVDEGAGDGDTLALPAGELVGLVVHALLEVYRAQGRLGALNALGIHAAVATVRGASTLTTAGIANPAISTVEDAGSIGGAVEAAGGYGDVKLMEDYSLFARMIQGGARTVNVAEPLIFYRVGEDAFRRRGGTALLRSELRVQREFLRNRFISPREYVRTVTVRGGYRLVPWWLRRAIYRPLVALHGRGGEPASPASRPQHRRSRVARPGLH